MLNAAPEVHHFHQPDVIENDDGILPERQLRQLFQKRGLGLAVLGSIDEDQFGLAQAIRMIRKYGRRLHIAYYLCDAAGYG